jgi:hypothetical protein
MTTLQHIERKFQMFQRAQRVADVTEGDWVRYHRNHAQKAQAAAAVLQTNREQILGALRDHFETRGFDRRIPYGFSGDGDCCPMACKFDETVDGGESFPIEIRLFVAAFDRGVFPEYDLAEVPTYSSIDAYGREDLREEVYARQAVYPPGETNQVQYPEAGL